MQVIERRKSQSQRIQQISPFVRKKQRAKRQRQVRVPWKLLVLLLVLSVVAYAGIFLVSFLPSLFAPAEAGVMRHFISEPKFEVRAAPSTLEQAFQIRHTVRRGETLGLILDKYGFSSDSILALVAALKASKDASVQVRASQELLFTLGETGELAVFETALDPERMLRVASSPEGYQVSIDTKVTVSREQTAVGVIESSFAAAARKAGIPYEIVDELVDLFSNRVSFHRDFRKGDRFTVIYQGALLEDGTPLSAGPIIAAALEVGETQMHAVRYVGSDGKARYFDQEGDLLGNTFLRYPLKFSRISSHFSKSRFHPVLKRRRAHNGVDFAAAIGTPVRSVADGRVLFAGRKGGNGIMLKIKHSDRYTTSYLHLSKISKGVRRGTRVRRGQVIGAVGMTGLATGPHLHYGFYDRGRYVDPLKIKLPTVERLGKGTKINKKYLKRAVMTLSHYQTIDLTSFYAGSNSKQT